MPATARQKACHACASSKRKCDKQLPECQRCLDRDVDCIYPTPKKRRRDPIVQRNEIENSAVLHDQVDTNTLGQGPESVDWDFGEIPDFEIDWSNVLIPFDQALPAPPAPVAIPSIHGLELQSGGDLRIPWFLREETWVLQHIKSHSACETDIEVEPFIHAVENMLQHWVKNGHNSFTHRRLYSKGMPICLQAAFTTLAAYTNRTLAVKEIILQIAEDHAFALAHQGLPAGGGASWILAHLARVQALFVYVFIRLFDGSVRARASAQQQLPILQQWVVSLWEAVKRYCEEDQPQRYYALPCTVSEFDRGYRAASELWDKWILTESVRRTHVVVDNVINIYRIMTQGSANCAGAVMLTARRNLWEAESAMKWVELSNANDPLLTPALHSETIIANQKAEEIDDFVKILWTFIDGKDKIKHWIDKDREPRSILGHCK
ncbi:MAG: hypothetical protein Q9219_002633 [cf. Caloplaca sp. 3 TL-2023]